MHGILSKIRTVVKRGTRPFRVGFKGLRCVADFCKFFLFYSGWGQLGSSILPLGHFLDQTVLRENVHFELGLLSLKIGNLSRPILKHWHNWRFLDIHLFRWSLSPSRFKIDHGIRILKRLISGFLSFFLFQGKFDFHHGLFWVFPLVWLADGHHVTFGLVHDIVIDFARLPHFFDVYGEACSLLDFRDQTLDLAAVFPELFSVG